MSQDTRGQSSGNAALPQGGGEDMPPNTGPDAAGLDPAPTLTDLLKALQADERVTDSLLADVLRAIRRELGDSAGDLAKRSLEHRSLSRRAVERVLQAAVRASAARKAARVSAGLASSGAESPPSTRMPSPHTQRRDLRLLQHCFELARANRPELADARALWQAAEALHDGVRAFLERQGRWPIADARAYEEHAKPAALVLASWASPEKD